MASIFISHSSIDKGIARQIAEDLKHIGHKVWFDEWKIDVGQSIPSCIESGLEETDFVVVLLSDHAVKSNWVDREWKAAYGDEISRSRVTVLPVLLNQCRIPKLLETKKYADFTRAYAPGFHDLAQSISRHRRLKENHERLMSESDKIGISGTWHTEIDQDEGPGGGRFIQELEIVLRTNEEGFIEGEYLDWVEVDGQRVYIDMVINGSLEPRRILKLDYRPEKDPSVLMFGYYVLEIGNISKSITGRFIGFGPVTNKVIGGFVKMTKIG